MDRQRWQRVEETFLAALERPTVERAAYLDEACSDDADLRTAVDELLANHIEVGGLLDEPPLRVPEEAVPEDRAVGPYRLTELLGRGGMGEVYLATQTAEDFKRPVAIKLIKRGMDTEGVLRRFQLERQILASLSHPHIAQLIDAGASDDGRPYFVMEYVDGVPIDEYCDREMLSVSDRIGIFTAVCDAVQHAHQNLVVHRDLKPGNVLVTAEGAPKLLDFGIGKLISLDAATDVDVTKTGMRILTPEYASPEQIRGGVITAASDVYGLGVLLFELLTGHHPTPRGTGSMASLERAILEDDVPRPSQVVGSVETRPHGEESETITPESVSMRRGTEPRRLRRRLAGDLDNILLKALRKDPSRRYAAVSALADDLRRHIDGQPVRARPDTFSYRASKFVSRHRLPVAAAVAIFLTMGAATLYSVEQSRRVSVERDEALEVEGFLLEMFGSSAPDAAGDAVTARQLLDRQVDALAAYDDRPALKARMTRVLAEGYDRLGLYPEAAELARASLDLRRATLSAGDPDIAASLNLLGWILHEGGESEDGSQMLREAIPMWRAAEDASGLSRALNDLGVMQEAAGEYSSADTLYAEALELRRGDGPAAIRAFAITASNLSVVRYRQGDFPAAVSMAEEALGAMRTALGPDHQRSIIIQSNLAAMQIAMGDPGGAATSYEDLLGRQERLQGPDHPVTLRVRSQLASALINLGRFPEAEAAFRGAMEGQERQLGFMHPLVGTAASGLGQALTRQQRLPEAIEILDRALAIFLEAYGEQHLRTADALEALADAHGFAGDRETAEGFHMRALASIDGAVGADNPTAAQVRMRLGDRLSQYGRPADALAWYGEAHATFADRLPANHVHTTRTRLRMAQVALRLERLDVTDSLLVAASEADPSGEHSGYAVLYDSLTTALAAARARN